MKKIVMRVFGVLMLLIVLALTIHMLVNWTSIIDFIKKMHGG